VQRREEKRREERRREGKRSAFAAVIIFGGLFREPAHERQYQYYLVVADHRRTGCAN
jgi:hypothetical protein